MVTGVAMETSSVVCAAFVQWLPGGGLCRRLLPWRPLS